MFPDMDKNYTAYIWNFIDVGHHCRGNDDITSGQDHLKRYVSQRSRAHLNR